MSATVITLGRLRLRRWEREHGDRYRSLIDERLELFTRRRTLDLPPGSPTRLEVEERLSAVNAELDWLIRRRLGR